MRFCLIILLVASLVSLPVCAGTLEAQMPNYWTEFDITFWQTLPFAAFWGYVIASQLTGGGVVEWSHIGYFAAAASALNAALHAGKTTAARSQPSQ
ncbi:hypothetical protein A2625_00565 [candidate division WOR-1 bacterium RIFCSPHIGHO2_01_FULL_53_15]|uniref:Uncharacterized protein n=1 Tax=candidate division WOR-1 bacterium RIFCSPHIGHO2_01_FULL_53_15 TaxID=1802564 RepID=A0A1F4Q3J6_UNCSA|nr:MAG: hypothetical protein A2625_00565 [candidate division WOR-1 bacterium RIFCSPHIGHO2_01_FULL_53_15]OGC12659.1 MAG: hypothetical protein A3D23_02830 [candidate division WOR-1 bacterium RIFCSPHIGHO2_02_FULL_53_26]